MMDISESFLKFSETSTDKNDKGRVFQNYWKVKKKTLHPVISDCLSGMQKWGSEQIECDWNNFTNHHSLRATKEFHLNRRPHL